MNLFVQVVIYSRSYLCKELPSRNWMVYDSGKAFSLNQMLKLSIQLMHLLRKLLSWFGNERSKLATLIQRKCGKTNFKFNLKHLKKLLLLFRLVLIASALGNYIDLSPRFIVIYKIVFSCLNLTYFVLIVIHTVK